MQNWIWKFGLVGLAAAALALLLAAEPESYSISPGQVARTLLQSGMQIKQGDVSLGANVVASKPDPEMRVLGFQPAAGPGNRKTLWIRIGCSQLGVCLPFYAAVAWNGDLAALPKAMRNAKTAHPDIGSPPVIRAGTHATLVIADDRSRVELTVVALQNGYVGQVIRVASPDRREFFRAEVAGATLLKGAM